MIVTKNNHKFLITKQPDSCPDFWDQLQNGDWEPYTFNVFDRMLNPDTHYIDLGAWVGPTVLYASQLCRQCYAFEPDPVAYEQLQENLAANDITNVAIFNEAVMDHDGSAELGSDQMGNSITRMGEAANRFSVKCRSLREFVIEYHPGQPLFIKMDVEGAEELILRDMLFFQALKPTVYLSTHPQWFQNGGMATVDKIARLYRWHIAIAKNTYLFTDCANA